MVEVGCAGSAPGFPQGRTDLVVPQPALSRTRDPAKSPKPPVLKCITTDDKTTNDKRRTAATHTALDAHRVEERLVVRAVGIPAAGVVVHRLLCGVAVLACVLDGAVLRVRGRPFAVCRVVSSAT